MTLSSRPRLLRAALLAPLAAALCGVLAGTAHAQEATIRKNLSERLPNLPKIEEVRKSAMPGLYEVRVNHSELLYTDAQGDFVLQGELINTQTRSNLTEERQNKLSAVDFQQLPLKDAFTIVRGNGQRKIAIFEDPNCGFCKRFEKDLTKISNVTLHVFLYPILGQDSTTKSQNIWCAKNPGKAFEDWMLRNIAPPSASCDTSALQRNVAFGRKYRITGTPTSFLMDGTRVPGALGADKLEALLNAAH